MTTRLYLITPPALEPARFADTLARALDAGDVACVQLRLKDCSDDAIRRAAEARRLLGAERIVGVTCHESRHLAMEAAEAGADYVAFGAFFPTATKEAKHRADPEILRWWSELMTVPSVAIGGITAANCAPLVRAGADFLAVISAVWAHPQGPDAAVKEFLRAIDAAAAEEPSR